MDLHKTVSCREKTKKFTAVKQMKHFLIKMSFMSSLTINSSGDMFFQTERLAEVSGAEAKYRKRCPFE